MPRTLPWLKDGGTGSSGTPRRERQPKRIRPSTPDLDDDLDVNTTGVSTPQRRARLRLESSPPSSPLKLPLDLEPMREGYSRDDIWMMVEDEFLSTAQLFTQHLHRAEYRRLQKLAAENTSPRGSGVTDGYMAYSRSAPSRPQHKKRDKDDKDQKLEDVRVEVADPSLAGLLDGVREEQVVLRRGPAMNTEPLAEEKARKVVKRQLGERAPVAVAVDGDATDSDDLDGPVKHSRPAAVLKREPLHRPITAAVTRPRTKSPIRHSHLASSPPTASRAANAPHFTSKANDLRAAASTTEPSHHTLLETQEEDKMAAMLAKRRARAKEKEKRQNEVKKISEIPTFLF